jgi:hypothetical protein
MLIQQDLYNFLKHLENLNMFLTDGEVRKLKFFSPDELISKKFTVDSYDLYSNGLLENDPEERKEYEGIDLIRDCEYDPEGVFVWFPEFHAYGSSDTDHGGIIIYPDVTWSDIVLSPTWYINGQWYPDRVSHQKVNPWKVNT